jgi:hypothetical protein
MLGVFPPHLAITAQYKYKFSAMAGSIYAVSSPSRGATMSPIYQFNAAQSDIFATYRQKILHGRHQWVGLLLVL